MYILKNIFKKFVYLIDDNVFRVFLCVMVLFIGGYRDVLRFKFVSVWFNRLF